MSCKIYWSIWPTPKQSDFLGLRVVGDDSALELEEENILLGKRQR